MVTAQLWGRPAPQPCAAGHVRWWAASSQTLQHATIHPCSIDPRSAEVGVRQMERSKVLPTREETASSSDPGPASPSGLGRPPAAQGRVQVRQVGSLGDLNERRDSLRGKPRRPPGSEPLCTFPFGQVIGCRSAVPIAVRAVNYPHRSVLHALRVAATLNGQMFALPGSVRYRLCRPRLAGSAEPSSTIGKDLMISMTVHGDDPSGVAAYVLERVSPTSRLLDGWRRLLPWLHA